MGVEGRILFNGHECGRRRENIIEMDMNVGVEGRILLKWT